MEAKLIKFDSDKKYTRLFSTKSKNALFLRSGCVVLKENESIGEHNTGDSEEIIIGLEGNGVLYTDGQKKLEFEKDSAVYIPPETVHDVKNIGKAPLKYVFVASQVSSSGGRSG